MRLLILGGTVFVGRHLAEAALARGHEVTLFHRGQHGADLFPQAEHLTGDRDGDLDALRGRRWDAVDRHLRLRPARRLRVRDPAGRRRRALHVHFLDLRL